MSFRLNLTLPDTYRCHLLDKASPPVDIVKAALVSYLNLDLGTMKPKVKPQVPEDGHTIGPVTREDAKRDEQEAEQESAEEEPKVARRVPLTWVEPEEVQALLAEWGD